MNIFTTVMRRNFLDQLERDKLKNLEFKYKMVRFTSEDNLKEFLYNAFTIRAKEYFKLLEKRNIVIYQEPQKYLHSYYTYKLYDEEFMQDIIGQLPIHTTINDNDDDSDDDCEITI